MPKVDRQTIDDGLQVSEYGVDILQNMLKSEKDTLPDPAYMKR
jgi:hypothetical protein